MHLLKAMAASLLCISQDVDTATSLVLIRCVNPLPFGIIGAVMLIYVSLTALWAILLKEAQISK